MNKGIGCIQYNLDQEKQCQDIHGETHIFYLSRQQLDDGETQHPKDDSVCNAIRERHEDDGQKRGALRLYR